MGALFDLAPEIRYVAVCGDGELSLRQIPGIGQASAAESDRYEELLVNPTLLKLTTQRGDIDCGGLRYVMVCYGNFYSLVVPTNRGHVSVAFEPRTGPIPHFFSHLGCAARAGARDIGGLSQDRALNRFIAASGPSSTTASTASAARGKASRTAASILLST